MFDPKNWVTEIHEIKEDSKGKKYIVREDFWGNKYKCYRKRGKGFHDVEKGILIEE